MEAKYVTFGLILTCKYSFSWYRRGEGVFFKVKGGGCKKNLGKKIGTLKAGGGEKIDPLARIYTLKIIKNLHKKFCEFRPRNLTVGAGFPWMMQVK